MIRRMRASCCLKISVAVAGEYVGIRLPPAIKNRGIVGTRSGPSLDRLVDA